MNRSKYIAVAAAAAMALTMAGCGFSGDDVVEVTPTPMATPTPTVISITATPLPTSTPAPKMIGKKTAQAKFIYLTNNLQNDIRELYLRVSGDDEGDWGNNLLSAETAFKAAEQVQMYYNGSSSDMSGQTDTENSTETSESSLKYDMKLVTADGSSYEIYSVDFGDMEKATLLLDQDGSSVYLRYDIAPEYSGAADGTAVVSMPYVSLDITDADAVDRVICEMKPDVVVHCAAWTAVDLAEDEDKKDKVHAINADGTANIAKACKKTGSKMVYISTDYVFDGRGNLEMN